jgi:transcriptional regulator with XRE-family HTH domain
MGEGGFPANLKRLRREKRLTVLGLSKRTKANGEAGLGERTISAYEAGDREPVLSSLVCLARALQIDVDQLVHEEKISE